MSYADQSPLIRQLRKAAIDRCNDRLTAKRLKPCSERGTEEESETYGISRRLRQLRGL